MAQWEYKTMTVINGVALEVKGEERTTRSLVQCLNEYGRKGWELVGVLPYALPGSTPNPNSTKLIFKRPGCPGRPEE
jgi:hypothetical protein